MCRRSRASTRRRSRGLYWLICGVPRRLYIISSSIVRGMSSLRSCCTLSRWLWLGSSLAYFFTTLATFSPFQSIVADRNKRIMLKTHYFPINIESVQKNKEIFAEIGRYHSQNRKRKDMRSNKADHSAISSCMLFLCRKLIIHKMHPKNKEFLLK